MKSLFVLVICLAVISAAWAHSAIYPPQILAKNALKKNNPDILSWHIHVVYNVYDRVAVKSALALRDVSINQFKSYLGADCYDRYDFARLCMIIDHNLTDPSDGGFGPFPSGEWSMFVPLGYYDVVVPWFLQNHGEFSLLVHPNTGFEYEDHSSWALWAGDRWPLNFHIFEKGKQTNEFGHSRGDSGNPVCLPKGALCGRKADLGPLAICCFGSACGCDPASGNCSCA